MTVGQDICGPCQCCPLCIEQWINRHRHQTNASCLIYENRQYYNAVRSEKTTSLKIMDWKMKWCTNFRTRKLQNLIQSCQFLIYKLLFTLKTTSELLLCTHTGYAHAVYPLNIPHFSAKIVRCSWYFLNILIILATHPRFGSAQYLQFFIYQPFDFVDHSWILHTVSS